MTKKMSSKSSIKKTSQQRIAGSLKAITSQKPLRFAVVGLGHIAQTAVLPAFQHAKNKAVLTAFVSGDPKKLKTLGRRYKVENLYSYDEYTACLQSGEVDAVYIALPNHLHCEYAVKALEHGVHVLCEKPLALNEADCIRMIRASQKSGAKLMTAYRLHFEEANLKAVAAAREDLGELRLFNSTFTMQVKDKENIRLKADGGGPLWDIGIYCINAARYFFRSEPVEVFATAASSADPRFAQVDEMTSVTLKFPDDRIATFICSFGASSCATYDVLGTKGRIHMESAYDYATPREMKVTINDESRTTVFKKADQFAPQLIYFSDCIRQNRNIEPSGFEGLADVRIIEGALESIRTGKKVNLKPIPVFLAQKLRPSIAQMMRRPSVRVPPQVNVTAPSL